MKCKKHRRYDGKTKPDNNCYDCWNKFINKSATYKDVCEELKIRKDRDPNLNLEPAFYEFEQIDSVSHMLRCYKWEKDEKIGEADMEAKDVLKRCSGLVLCKNELFFQTNDGRTLKTWYPVGKEAASACSLYFNIPLTYEGGDVINNEEVINESLIRLSS